VLIINHTSELGGAEFVLLDVAEHFGARCHVLLFADGPLTERLARLGVGFTVLPAVNAIAGVRRNSSRLRALASAPAVAALALKVARIGRGYDVLYPNSEKAAVIAMLIARLIRRPVVWHLHDILSNEHFAPLQLRLMAVLANLSARRVISVSRAGRDAFVRNGGDPQLVTVVYNGFRPDHINAGSLADAARIRLEFGVSDAPLVGMFGRITSWKGQHVLLRALAKLSGVHALFVGAPLFGEREHADELRVLADELGVADRVHWLGHRDDVPALMQAVNVVVQSSTSPEPCARVIVEGMLAGRPVLASDAGGSPELLGGDEFALVPPGDPALLAAGLRRILDLPEADRIALGDRNRERAQSLFSMPAMLAGISRAVDLDTAAS
jgi:glycosyltransferase involved in cell wall biosynthesis